MVLSVFQSVESCGIHSQEPVANGSAHSRKIERLIVFLAFQLLEAFGNGFIGHRRDPQSLHWTFRPSLLHHPSLNQFSLLPGIAAVHNFVGVLHQLLYYSKLPLYVFLMNQLNAKPLWNHGQTTQRPRLPSLGVVVWFLQGAKVSVGPCHLIAIAFNIAIARCRGTQDACNLPRHTWFLCNANNHQ